MMENINTKHAPSAIGPYSQAIRHGNTVYLSGQIPLDPETMNIVSSDIEAQARQVFENLKAVCRAAGGDLSHIVKLSIYLVSLDDFAIVNTVMEHYFRSPYPARVTIGVQSLPKAAKIEIDGIMVIVE